MGLKKMLEQGAAGEKEQIAKANAKPKSAPKKEADSKVIQIPPEEPVKKSKKEEEPKKHPGGRPTNESKGKTSRKQYSLTLLPDDYEKFLDLANADGLTFSKYIERAVNEYISSHQNE